MLLGPSGVLAFVAGPPGPYARPPDATLDLATEEGTAALGALWRYHDARIVEVAYRFGRRVEHSELFGQLGQLLRSQNLVSFAHTLGFLLVVAEP